MKLKTASSPTEQAALRTRLRQIKDLGKILDVSEGGDVDEIEKSLAHEKATRPLLSHFRQFRKLAENLQAQKTGETHVQDPPTLKTQRPKK